MIFVFIFIPMLLNCKAEYKFRRHITRPLGPFHINHNHIIDNMYRHFTSYVLFVKHLKSSEYLSIGTNYLYNIILIVLNRMRQVENTY